MPGGGGRTGTSSDIAIISFSAIDRDARKRIVDVAVDSMEGKSWQCD